MMGQSTAFRLQMTKAFFFMAKKGKTTAVTVFIWPKREKPQPSPFLSGQNGKNHILQGGLMVASTLSAGHLSIVAVIHPSW